MDIKEKNTKSVSDIMLIVYYDDNSYSKSFFLEKSDLDCSSLFRGKRKGSYGFIPKIPNFLQKT
ncbi:MAG: hypothetical protein IJ583_03275 [Firmicutes bacterium]|nr:hypothetical protein [Bacillota bacterium]